MRLIKNIIMGLNKKKENTYDFFEAILIFFICFLSTFSLHLAHTTSFSPFLKNLFLFEFSAFLTVCSLFVVFYEWQLTFVDN
jgi:hypothetical protein